MQQTAFKQLFAEAEQLAGEVRAITEDIVREAADIERFIREYPRFNPPKINISPKGRNLGPMYVVTVQGHRVVDLTPGGEADRKLCALVERVQHKRRAHN